MAQVREQIPADSESLPACYCLVAALIAMLNPLLEDT